MTGTGVVILLDATGMVLFAAPHGLVPPARSSDQSSTPLIAAALKASATVERDDAFVSYRGGGTSEHCYGQVTPCGDDYLIAVLATDNAAWRPFAPPRPNTARSSRGRWWTCETCETRFQAWDEPCGRCGDPRCPDGHCGCTAARAATDRQCDACFLTLALARFDGDSPTCRDCA
jgi:hypothetical protein